MALNQVVLPGFAAYRIGTATTPSKMSRQPDDEDGDEETAPPTEEADPPRSP
jgi:hypothetical protein